MLPTSRSLQLKFRFSFSQIFFFCVFHRKLFQEELRKFNAKRRWKSAILTVVAANKFKTMLQMKKVRFSSLSFEFLFLLFNAALSSQVREAKPRKAKNLRLSSLKNMFGMGKK
jgi:hypothetical protein